jgi:hypothetical protein
MILGEFVQAIRAATSHRTITDIAEKEQASTDGLTQERRRLKTWPQNST